VNRENLQLAGWIGAAALMVGLFLHAALSGQLDAQQSKPQPQAAPIVRTLRKIDDYSTFAQLRQHLGRPNSIRREGNTIVMQYTDLNVEPTMWQLDVRLSGGAVPVPRN